MFKVHVPFKVKIGALTAATVVSPFLNSCKKEKVDPYAEQKEDCANKGGDFFWDDEQKLCVSPIAERIKELTAQEKTLAKEVRGAVKPALTQPEDIQEWYLDRFNYLNAQVQYAKNLLDSANVHIRTIDGMYNAYGNPLPINNDANIAKLYEKCNAYVPVVTELNNLLQK